MDIMAATLHVLQQDMVRVETQLLKNDCETLVLKNTLNRRVTSSQVI